MKSAFSLLELIFAIVVIGIIASYAIPKYLDTRNSAVISTLKRDINTTITSIQSYNLINGDIEKISDAITLNTKLWTIEDKKVTYKENDKSCIVIELKDGQVDLTLDSSTGDICKKIVDEEGISNTSYNLI